MSNIVIITHRILKICLIYKLFSKYQPKNHLKMKKNNCFIVFLDVENPLELVKNYNEMYIDDIKLNIELSHRYINNRCVEINKNGIRCKRKISKDSTCRCWQHLKMHEKDNNKKIIKKDLADDEINIQRINCKNPFFEPLIFKIKEDNSNKWNQYLKILRKMR